MTDKNMRLRVVLDLADKALAPLKRISQGSADTAKTLKAAREQLKKLNEQQAAVGHFEKHQQALRQSSNQLKVLQQNLKTLQATGGTSASQIKLHQAAIEKQTAKFKEQQATVFKLRSGLNALGISQVSSAQQRLAADITADGDQHRWATSARDAFDGVRATWSDSVNGKRKEVIAGKKTRNMKTLKETYASEQDALDAARSEMQRLERGSATFSLSLAIGRPEITAQSPIAVHGFKPEIDGQDWLVKEVTHRMDGASGWTSQVQMERHYRTFM